jgi:hypothetical protein
MNRDSDYLQKALLSFNVGKSQWYGWRKVDENGNKIPNNQRMTYENLILNDNTATMPTEAEVNTKIQELKDAEADAETKKASGKQKLLDLGLTEEEVKALIGV